MSKRPERMIRLTKKQLREMVEASSMPERVDERLIADVVDGFLWEHIVLWDLDGMGDAEVSDIVGRLGGRISGLIAQELETLRELGAEWE